jgi:hypothetical protein
VSSVFRLYRCEWLLRQCVAAATSLALILQLLLSATLLSQLAGSAAEAFVVCHGTQASSPADEPDPGSPASDPSHCVFCALTSSGVLPAAPRVAASVASVCSFRLGPRIAQVTSYHSPTGKYQRGPPPTHPHIAG